MNTNNSLGNLNIGHINIRSINNKKTELSKFLKDYKIDILSECK